MRAKTKKGNTPLKTVVTGTAAGIIAAALFSAVIAFILTKNDVDQKYLPLFVYTAGGLGSFISAFMNTKKLQFRGIYSGLISSLVFSGLYLLICFILSGFSAKITLFITVPVNLITGVFGAIISKNIK